MKRANKEPFYPKSNKYFIKMPYSYNKFKHNVREHILLELQNTSNPRVLDVGAGSGTYADLLKIPMDAVEIWDPYIAQFNLAAKYNTIYQQSIMTVNILMYDYIILGDILEHLTPTDATLLMGQIETYNIKCIVAVPYLFEQGEYEGNIYETHHQPDLTPEIMASRYPNLKLLYGDDEYGYYINYEPHVAPNLIISSGRRFDYFLRTLKSLQKHNPNYRTMFNEVWVLDDRSTPEERLKMEFYLDALFGQKAHVVTFNSNGQFDYVDKFNMIKHLMGPSEFVFLLEDDWESVRPLDLSKHINYLKKHSAFDQIMFSQVFDIQSDEIKAETSLNEYYWKNPFPKNYRHFYEMQDGFLKWQEVRMNNYGNNPSIFRRRVFENKVFHKDHGWELKFADEYPNRQMILTKENLFIHIGQKSLIDINPKP
jgi:hypothetical protein